MPISKQTLKRMVADFDLIPLSDKELEDVIPDVETNLANLKKIRALKLGKVPTARQMVPLRSPQVHFITGGKPDVK